MPKFPGGKRYRAFGPAMREIFGARLQRISLDAGFTCPTRDGTLGEGGCLYCDAVGARASHVRRAEPVRDQLARGIQLATRRYGANRFIAYFQAFSNTYGDPALLRRLYNEALEDPRVEGLVIATRSDCLDDAVLDTLEEFATRAYLWVEIGLQSTSDATLRQMRRGHTVAQFTHAAERLRERGIRTVAHVIAGLPGDSPRQTLEAADLLSDLGVWGVKMHNLYVSSRSPLAEPYQRGELHLLEQAEYLDILIAFIARLAPEIIIHRVMAQAPRSHHLGPDWSLLKQEFLRELDAELEKHALFQGSLRAPATPNTPDAKHRP